MPRKKESAMHKKLAAELASLMPDLDEEGLSFLIEQARVHLYNMEVTRLESEREALETSQDSAASADGKSKSAGKRKGGKKSSAEADSGPANFRVERSSSGSTYHLISGGKWKMYNEAEMLSIVSIAQSKDPLLEVTERLCRWFETERPDTFADLELGDQHDPKMKELVKFLRKKFAVRK